MLRLYTNILATRVQDTFKINEKQRGFIKVAGCSENGFLIEEIIKQAQKKRTPLCVAFLDLTKVFDTVSHKHIKAGLKRFDACYHFIQIVEELYKDASTIFTRAKRCTKKILITRGVKQGEPLSSLLFNKAMNTLLAEILRLECGYKFGPSQADRIESLACADDDALLT